MAPIGHSHVAATCFYFLLTLPRRSNTLVAELSNAFNMVSLVIPTAALATTGNANQGILTSSLFGQIRNAGDMRQVQLGLRLTF